MQSMQLIHPADKDLGGDFHVRRVLPSRERRSVGPFVFFDHFGPVTEGPGDSHDVRPHPHIGLATVTYLFEGAMMHRDSLGNAQEILPGAINWMTAGRGIVHSERKPDRLRSDVFTNHGLQLWCALPLAHEETAPSFAHTPADAIPAIVEQGASVRLLVGNAFGARSSVGTLAPTLYLDIQLPAGGAFQLPSLADEMAVYAVDGPLKVDAMQVPAQTMAVLPDGAGGLLRADDAAVRLVVIGGEALEGERHIVWNFVSSRHDRILAAGADWAAQRMGQVPGETEFIPLPEKPFGAQPADARTTPG